MQLTTDGIVLRAQRIQEDRKLTLLTLHSGVLEAWANGAGRPRSRLAASTELFCFSQLVLFSSRGRYTVDKADPHRVFFGIREDLNKLALASYLAELTAALAPQGEEAGTYLRLLLNTLHLLEENRRPALQCKALYELRLATLSGYMPDLVACPGCGRFEHEAMYFFPVSGRLCCGACLDGQVPGGVRITPGVLAAMRHVVYCEGDKLYAFTLSDEGLRSLSSVCEDYVKAQLEKTFPTLEFFHTITGQ